MRTVRKVTTQRDGEILSEQRSHSLKYYPHYPSNMRQHYANDSDQAKILAKFRLGDINLGLRDDPPITNCPCCATASNDAMHLVFDCSVIQSRCNTDNVLEKAQESQLYDRGDPGKLQSFLGGDFAPIKTMMKRADYLLRIIQEHSDAVKLHNLMYNIQI